MKPDLHIPTASALSGWIAVLLALPILFAPGAARGGALPRIVDLRVGEHAGFDRLVIQLDREASASWHFAGTDVVIELQARPIRAARALSGSEKRMGSLWIRSEKGGATLRARAATRRIRAFWLSGPTRLVVDFGDPSSEPFPLARGLIALPESASKPETAETGEAAHESEVSLPPGSPIPPAASLPEVEPRAAEAPAPESGGLQEGEGLSPGSELGLPAPVPVLDLSQEPPWQPSRQHRLSAWLERFGGVDRIWVSLWFGLPFLAAAGMIWIVGHRRRGAVPSRLEHPDPREMSADELLDAAERIDLLEMRIDEEARGRMKLEERTTELQEDVKVLKDRLLRLARREGSPSPSH